MCLHCAYSVLSIDVRYDPVCNKVEKKSLACATLLQALVAAEDSALTTGSPTFPGICSSSSTLKARISICIVL